MSFQNEKYPKLANKKECTGCLACVDSCPKKAIGYYQGDDGHVYVYVKKEHCIGCRICERVCVSSRLNYGNNDLNMSQVYAAWSSNQEDRKYATSGGVFASLARYIIENGGVVVGACLQGKECSHILIDNVYDIKKLQGSKYMSSSMEGIYKTIEKKIRHGKVLFSGVGCQCAGVLAYFENNKYRDNLITMDLVCGGLPSRILLDKFYQENPDIEGIVSFRKKDKYELRVKEKGVEKIIDAKSLPLHGFNCGLTNRYSCYYCQFSCAHRKTDMTIGDLWNYDYMFDEHIKGISSVIVHSQRGKDFLEKASVVLNDIRWDECINYCKRIVWGKEPLFYPRKKLAEYSEKLNYEEFKQLYCMDIKPRNLKLFMFRIYRFVSMRLNSLIAKIYIRYIEYKSIRR